MKNSSQSLRTLAATLGVTAGFVGSAQPVHAEDADRFRPYIRFHSGDVDPLWGVDDMWSFAFGANFDRHWGAEMGLEFYQMDFDHEGDRLGEVGAFHLVPHLRWRYPLYKDKIVPYLIGGVGASILQFNDRKPDAYGREVSAEDATLTVVAGGGVEFYLADNVSFDLMGRYFWMQPIEGSVDNQPVDVDLSAPTFTFGLRIYLDQNDPQPFLTEAMEEVPSRFYFGVRFGYSVFTDSSWTSNSDWETEPQALGGTWNLSGGLLLGMDFGNNWGVELTGESLEYRINTDEFGRIGEYGMGMVLANVRYRMPSDDGRWVPYVAAGFGMTYGEFNDRMPNGAGLEVDARGFYPTVGLTAGVDYFVVRNVSFFADANWNYTWGHNIEIDGSSVNGKGDFSNLMFHLGFRVYLFD